MKFEWDEQKNLSNIEKHGLDFQDVQSAFMQPILTKKDERFEYGEDRLISVGKIANFCIVIIWTKRNNTIRLISARLANKKERKIYDEHINKN